MKPKKSKRANLENYRTIFLQIGIILVLSAILLAFEWKTTVELEELQYIVGQGDVIEEIIPITKPKAEEKKKVEVPSFEIKPDEYDVPEVDLDKFDAEIGADEKFDIPDFGDIEEPDKVDEPVIFAEFMPTFQGKDVLHFRNYIAQNVKFPRTAVENGISGTVFVGFVVDKDGSVSDVQIIREVHPIIDKAVVKVIENSPKWEPGINNGRYVRVRFTIAIKFDLIQ